MAVLLDRHGPDWPLGFIEVAVPGTPVKLTSLVDPTDARAPEARTSEYSPRCQQILLQAFKPGVAHGMQVNAGFVYIVRKGGDRDDYGTIVKVLSPGESFYLASAPSVKDVFSPYRYYVDGDNAGDGVLAVLLIF